MVATAAPNMPSKQEVTEVLKRKKELTIEGLSRAKPTKQFLMAATLCLASAFAFFCCPIFIERPQQ